MKTIYIADSYSLNTGDIGILVATVSSLRKSAPDTKIYIESSHPEALAEYDLRCEIFPRIFDISRIVGKTFSKGTLIKAIIAGTYDSLTFLLFAIASRWHLPAIWMVRPSRRRQARALQEIDLWLSSGGGYLSSFYHPELRFYGYYLMHIMRKPYMIFAQSVGPFTNKLHQRLARFFLDRAAAITIREDDSYQYMQAFGTKKPLALTADIAFLLPMDKNLRTRSVRQKSIAICVKKSDANYEASMHFAAQKLIAKGYFIHYVSQTPNDDALAQKLQERSKDHASYVPFGMDARKVKGLYASCDLIIATRMHALIFATEQHIPWIGIGYEPKFRGLSKQLGKTGILIEENELTSATVDQAIDKIMTMPQPAVHPAEALTAKAQENTNVLVTVLDGIA